MLKLGLPLISVLAVAYCDDEVSEPPDTLVWQPTGGIEGGFMTGVLQISALRQQMHSAKVDRFAK